MKKYIYIGLFAGLVLFMIQLPSIVKKITVNKLEKTIGRKVRSGDFRYNYVKNILSIENLKIYEDDGKNIFVEFDSLDVNIDIIPLLKRKFYIRELTLVNPNFVLKYNDGIANFESILKKISSETNKVAAGNETDPYIKSIELKNITINNFTFYYNDKLIKGENKFTIQTPQILYENKNIILNSRIDFYGNGTLNLNLEYKKDGTLSGKIETKEFLLDDKLYILKSLYNLKKLNGKIDSNFNFNCNLFKDIYNLKGKFILKDLNVSSAEVGNLLSIERIEGKIEDFKIKENKFFLEDIKTNKGIIDIENIKKYISFISKNSNKKEDVRNKESEKLKYPILNIKKFQISDYKIYDEKINLEVERFQINDLGTLEGDSKVEFAGKFQDAKVNFNGEIKKEKAIKEKKDIDSIGVKGEVDIVSLDLKDIDLFLQETLYLNGSLDLSLKFNYLGDNLQMENMIFLNKFSFKKDHMTLKIENLRSNNTILKDSKDYHIKGMIEAEDGTLNMKEVDFWFKNTDIEITELSQNNIILNRLRLESPWVKIKKDKDNSEKDITQEKNTKDYTADSSEEGKKEKIEHPILFIETVNVSSGRLDYIHKDLKYNLRNIIIDIKDFTTEKNKNFNGNVKADLTGNGKLKFNFLSSLEKNEDFSPISLNIDGQLDIFNLNFLDFNQILSKNLPNEIDNGKLNYNGNFILDKGKIIGKNLIFIKKIDIGEKTKVTSVIPLKLGVNILKDREDNLRLDLPISGDFNNPKFKISRVILEGLKNILIRAVTSPANFILSTFNIGEKKDLFIEYEYLNSNFKTNKIMEKVVEILEKKEDINIIFTLFTDKEIEKKLLNTRLREEMFFKRDTKDEILEKEIDKIIIERKETIKDYFKTRNLEKRVKVEISDIPRKIPISSIELMIKK